MCGRYLLRASKKELAEAFESVEENLPVLRYGRYNIAPTQDVLIAIREQPAAQLRFLGCRWGLIPAWKANQGNTQPLINARSETVAEKASFRDSFRKRRCLIIADGFYEWKRDLEKKQPYLFTLKSEKVFAFAGIYEKRESENGEEEYSCAILTVEANATVRDVHDRMPVILETKEQWERWLDAQNSSPEELLRPLPAEHMQAIVVSLLVNNARNDLKDCVQPLLVGES